MLKLQQQLLEPHNLTLKTPRFRLRGVFVCAIYGV
jgi:hypothetical protein